MRSTVTITAIIHPGWFVHASKFRLLVTAIASLDTDIPLIPEELSKMNECANHAQATIDRYLDSDGPYLVRWIKRRDPAFLDYYNENSAFYRSVKTSLVDLKTENGDVRYTLQRQSADEEVLSTEEIVG